MKRAGFGVALLVLAGAFALLITPASADPVCSVATPLPVLGGVLSGGVQTGLLNVGPVCPSSGTAPVPSPATSGIPPKPSANGQGLGSKGSTTTASQPAARPATVRGATSQPNTRTTSPTSGKAKTDSRRELLRIAEIFTWINTPARVAFAAFCVFALIIEIWMGIRVGRKRASRSANVAADAQLAAVMSVVPDAIVVTDEKNEIRAMNAAASEMLGAAGETRGSLVSRFIRGSERSGITLESWMRSTADYASGTTGTLDGGLPVGIAAAPVHAEKKLVGHVFLVRDLRKERALDRMKEEFLSNISHELRTPLASALGFARLLQRRELSATQQGAFVGAIVEACERLDRVVDLLIDVAALDGGNARIDSERVDIAELVRDAADRWSDRSASHVITARTGDQIEPIAAGSALLRNSIDELIDNAIKFSPDGGIVTIAVERLTHESKPTIAISVADQGIGIDPMKREAVFEDFHQVDGSATRRFGGLGIGLAFVRRVAEAHGGRVDIVSEQGSGSTFSLVLPARIPRSQTKKAAPTTTRKATSSARRPQRVVRVDGA
ncbi:MAG TPA: ATP-binding protein [Actinomycetota bacterium]|nr:ATP-binding protein [Actinomycetota bacterium]